MRWWFRLFPAYRGTGGRVTYVSSDFHEAHVELPLSRRTRNRVGTIFGGSLYGAVDPVYMILLMQILGPGYTVWDKAASIRFRKPGKTTLFARFLLTDEEIATIRKLTAEARSIDRVYAVDLADAAGVVHATIEKTIYIRKNQAAGLP